jgi:hypothetical protein
MRKSLGLNARDMQHTSNPHAMRIRFEIKIADCRERDHALLLRRKFFQEHFGHHGVDAYDEYALQVIAVDPEQQVIVGGARFMGPSPLPAEVLAYCGAVEKHLWSDRWAQVGGLWILPTHRRVHAGLTSLSIFRFVIQLAERFQVQWLVLRTLKAFKRVLQPYYQAVGFRYVSDLDFVDPCWGPSFVMLRSVGSPVRSGHDGYRIGARTDLRSS